MHSVPNKCLTTYRLTYIILSSTWCHVNLDLSCDLFPTKPQSSQRNNFAVFAESMTIYN